GEALTYRVELDSRAARALAALPKNAVARISEAISALAEEPRPPGARKLTARGGHRIRVGDYRVLYELEDRERRVRIYAVGHRKEIYR
ncbi:MAG: type II toxin-antitoxin system RelE family toxin, partial [Thermoanaerobaculia bacterium]